MRPTVGRTVHYVSYGTPGGEYHSKCRAAMIVEVGQWINVKTVEEIPNEQRTVHQVYEPEACALSVFNPTGVFFNGAAGVVCEHDETTVQPSETPMAPKFAYRGGTWHWPERVEDG
jgi:hypothetical protein